MILHIQNILREGRLFGDKSIEGTLKRFPELGLHAKRHEKIPNLVSLKYDQIASPMSNPAVQECRGLIVDEADNFTVVARPFNKFFNYGEGHAAPIDWATARVQEKVDGTLCILYNYMGGWHVGTTGTPDASGPVGGLNMTFADLFWKTWEKMLGCLPEDDGLSNLDPGLTHLFELTTPFNRVVVPHRESKLTWLASRDRVTGFYARGFMPIPSVWTYPLQSMEDIQKTFETLDPLHNEGYVIVDGSNCRVKVKHPGYVAIHHLKDSHGKSMKSLLSIVLNGESAEFGNYFAEYKPLLDEVRQKYDSLVAELEAAYAKVKDIPVQKDFALAIRGVRSTGPLFMLRAGKVKSIDESLRDMPVQNLLSLIGVQDLIFPA
jgi:hypothetical protein